MKRRVEWIDNARVIAAVLIMALHVGGLGIHPPAFSMHCASSLVSGSNFGAPVPFFFIVAGYFLARNITWKKAWNRFVWLLIPFVIWNLAVYFISAGEVSSPSLFKILGVGSVLLESLSISDDPWQVPVLPPTWFLRDIILLSLLTPLFDKFRACIPALLILCVSTTAWTKGFAYGVTISLTSCIYYLLGVWLSRFTPEAANRIFNSKFTFIAVAGSVAGMAMVFWNAYMCGENSMRSPWATTLAGKVFGVMIIAHVGVLIEQHLPRLSRFLARCAPACFLTFVLHYPLYTLVLAPVLPEAVKGSSLSLLLPLPVFFLIVGLYIAMERYAPFLLPYLAHVKPRK